jgi:DNA-binding GntR family transcriptional regulator
MRASDIAYQRLRDDIITWRRRPGEVLGEIELAAELGISRTPLRAALARLAMEGLVDTSRRTAVVSAVSPQGTAELFELRAALEASAVRLAARRGERAAFAQLADRFAAATDLLASAGVDAYYGLVADFDRAVGEAIGNAAFSGALDSVRTHLERARHVAADDPERLVRTASEHRLICEAIRDHDEDLAASATLVHLRGALVALLDALPAEGRTVEAVAR